MDAKDDSGSTALTLAAQHKLSDAAGYEQLAKLLGIRDGDAGLPPLLPAKKSADRAPAESKPPRLSPRGRSGSDLDWEEDCGSYRAVSYKRPSAVGGSRG